MLKLIILWRRHLTMIDRKDKNFVNRELSSSKKVKFV